MVYLPGPICRGKCTDFKGKGHCKWEILSLRRRGETAKDWVSDKHGHTPWDIKREGRKMSTGVGIGGFGSKRRRQLSFSQWGISWLWTTEVGEGIKYLTCKKEKLAFYKMCWDCWAILPTNLMEHLNKSCNHDSVFYCHYVQQPGWGAEWVEKGGQYVRGNERPGSWN